MEWMLGIFVLAGIVAGFLAGLLGIGGGLVVVPVMFFVLSSDPAAATYAMHVALGSSLAFIVINSGIAAIMHWRLGGLRWRELGWMAPGLVIGSLAGARLADEFPTAALQRWFGIFLLVMAAYLFLQRHPPLPKADRPWLSAIAGLPIGGVASLAGVGGGVMVVPWLLARGHRAAVAVATSSACTVIVAFVGSVGYMLFASETPLPYSTGYIYWPAVAAFAVTAIFTAPLGAKTAHRIDQSKLRRGFALLVLLVGLKLLVD
ncbi:MAG: sulfite exporter TauE/SafE family protein [Gammaproteobacteria bacterium]|nr:sulfite exporter TauE/SafE family protein [Gammaproteobacteria bacterium]